DELHDISMDVQTLNNEDNYDDNPLFNFEQNLYKQALNLTEHQDDLWKELNAEDMIEQDINYEEIEEIEEIDSEYRNIVDIGCIAEHSNDTTTALYHFAKLIEIVAESEDDNVKKHLLQALYPCLKNFDLNSSSTQINKLPSLFVVNTAFKIKKLDFSKQLKQFTLKPKKCEEFGDLLALEILKSRTSLSSHKETLESPKTLQQYYEAMPKCLTSFFDGLILTLQLKNYEIVKRKQKERKTTITELSKSEIIKMEKRIAKGRAKKDLEPLLLGKKASQSKKKRNMEDISL
ncbi:1631_t:CDS:2, partial [Acaulospora morrowiae]